MLKIVALLFAGSMFSIQIPELRYDLGPKTPVIIDESGEITEITPEAFPRSTFVSLGGQSDFTHGFVYKRYGLSYTYFNIKPYGMRIVVRTYQPVTDEWKKLNRFVGKLRPFNRQPFHYKIRKIYRDKFQIDVPAEAFFMALDDVPRISGWQIGATVFSGLMFLFIFYITFIYPRCSGKKGDR